MGNSNFFSTLEEMKASLLKHSAVRKVIMVGCGDGGKAKRVVAYIVYNGSPGPTINELRSFLLKRLPDYIILSVFVPVKALPLLQEGALNRGSDPAADQGRPGLRQDDAVGVLKRIWAEVLGLDQVGSHDNFLELGGNSLQGARVVARVRQRLCRDVSLRHIFDFPTPAAFADMLRESACGGGTPTYSLQPAPRTSGIPLSYHQQSHWFPDRLMPDTSAFNTRFAIRMNWPVVPAVLQRSLNRVIQRHEILRTTFQVKENRCTQVISTSLNLEIPLADLQHIPVNQREEVIQSIARDEGNIPFDLSTGPLMRVNLIKFDQREYILLVIVHRAVFDGWSLKVFARELGIYCEADLAGRSVSLPALPIQYADYAVWQRSCLRGECLTRLLRYWQEALAGIDGILELPTHRPRPLIRTYRGDTKSVVLPPRLKSGLLTFSRRESVTPFMTLLAVFKVLLHRWSSRPDIPVGCPVANRIFPETEASIGPFANILVLRSRLSPHMSFRELLQQVRETALSAYEHQLLPFEKLVEVLYPGQNLSYNPLFQVMFVYRGTSLPVPEPRQLSMEVYQMEDDSAISDLTLEARESGMDLEVRMDYNRDLFSAATIQRMLIYYQGLLEVIVTGSPSLDIPAAEFTKWYSGEEPGQVRLRYRDYSRWKKSETREQTLKKREEYWLNEFSCEPAVLQLPMDFPRPTVKSIEGSCVSFFLDKIETSLLREISRKNDTVPFVTLLAVFNILLCRLSGQEDIIIGTSVAGGNHGYPQDIMGMFVNTLALRNYPAGKKPFLSFLEEVKRKILSAFENREYRFEDLVEKVALHGDTSRNPIFDVMFNLVDRCEYEGEIPGVSTAISDGGPGFSLFDITLTAVEVDDYFFLSLVYYSKLFKASTMRRFAGYFRAIVSSVIKAPGTALCDIDFIPEVEKRWILDEFNDTGTFFHEGKTVVHLLEEQAARAPGRTAAIGSGQWAVGREYHLSYGELNRRSGQLAHVLKEKGVIPDTIVGILLDRSIDIIIGILGILKAGGAYLPIDPAYPQERIDYMLADSEARILLSEVSEGSKVSEGTEMMDLPSLIVEKQDAEPTHLTRLTHLTHPTHLCYIIYTSGTTGKPKGLIVEHRNLSAYLEAFDRKFHLVEKDVVLQQASYSFDTSVEELYPVLLKGGRLVIAGKDRVLDVDRLAEFIARHWVTVISCSPLMLNQLNGVKGIESIRLFISGGDVLKSEYITGLVRKGAVYNGYGPSESTVCATYYRCGEKPVARIPIGKPLAGYKVYIADKYGRIIPVGVSGELCIGGPGLARGYLNRPELTARKFVDYRFYRSYRSYKFYSLYSSKRIYKTGDLARWLPDGNIEFLGRVDRQVKIRGYRIEPGEVEHALTGHPRVKEAVVTTGEEAGEDVRLTAYLVFYAGTIPGSDELRSFLKRTLPEYMIPSAYVALDSLPLFPNGKVDRTALPPPIWSNSPMPIPRDECFTRHEQVIAGIWKSVLRMERIGADQNFFDLGGNSLSMAQVRDRIREHLQRDIPIIDLYRCPTIRTQARHLGNRDETEVPGHDFEHRAIMQKKAWNRTKRQKNLRSKHGRR